MNRISSLCFSQIKDLDFDTVNFGGNIKVNLRIKIVVEFWQDLGYIKMKRSVTLYGTKFDLASLTALTSEKVDYLQMCIISLLGNISY